MPNHDMNLMFLGQRFYVYCSCGWHSDDQFGSIHEAAGAWFNHKEVKWVHEEEHP